MCFKADLSKLSSYRCAYGAGYRDGNRNGCLKGTRESVLNEIECWTEDFDKSPIFWLDGLAGTGKSTIAQTVSERMFADNRLGASFFCSRGDGDRRDLQLIFPTLAIQLAHQYPNFRSSLVPLLRSNPDTVHGSLQEQMHKFLVGPLRSAGISTVIVIDALDECTDNGPESAILLALGQSVSQIPRVKFLITGRPETHILSGFSSPLLKGLTKTLILHRAGRRSVDGDIRRFLKHRSSGITGRPKGWPTEEQLDLLCRMADGSFLFAAEAVSGGDAWFTSLDSLYRSIFQRVFPENGDDDAVVRSILSAVVLVASPLPQSAIATLLRFEFDVVRRVLEPIQSLLILPEDPNYPVQPFHESLTDFITDPTRCIDARFYISPNHHHAELVLHCLGLMEESLKKDMFSIPDYILNSEVEDLPTRIGESGLRGALEYACRSWHMHLFATKDRVPDVVSALRRFLEQKFLFWLEVMSALEAMDDAARALNMTVEWVNEVGPDRQFDFQVYWR